MHIQFISNKTAYTTRQPLSRVDLVFEGNQIGTASAGGQADSILSYVSQIQSEFNGKAGQVLFTSHAYDASKQAFLGMGAGNKLTEAATQKIGAKLYAELAAQGVKDVFVTADQTADTKIDNAVLAAHLADALLRQSYSFDKYKSGNLPEKNVKRKLETVTIAVEDPVAAEAAFAPLRAVTESSFWAADLANEPPNVLYPETYAQRIDLELSRLGANVRILRPQEVQNRGFEGVWNVGKGSEHLPHIVVVEYDGTQGQQKEPLVLVGKGVTFDTGGISIKPGAGMDDMKYDMGGSAAVMGAIRAAAARKAKAHIVAIVGLAENTPSHTSYRPGDIVKTKSGITVHIGNTDAEGRMVLCDLLYLAQHLEEMGGNSVNVRPHITDARPRAIFDAATLTGAQVTALGDERAAVYSSSGGLSAKFMRAGMASGELCWPMPLGQEYADAMRHKQADLNNISTGSKAGSCTAAEFLHYFIEKDENGKDRVPWAHIDLAGPGIRHPGWGVRVLDRMIRDYYEEKPVKSPSARPVSPPPDMSPLV